MNNHELHNESARQQLKALLFSQKVGRERFCSNI
jgi:hypothetical protein